MPGRASWIPSSILGSAAVSGISLLSFVNGTFSRSAQVRPEAAIDQASDQAEQHHEHDQGQRRRPGLVVGGLHLNPGVLVFAVGEDARFCIRPSRGLELTESITPVVTRRGAVSPITRATASITPVTNPAIAVGRTMRSTTFHFGVPSAYAASRRWLGTIFRISSAERMTIGVIRTARATEPITPRRIPGPRNRAKRA